VPFRGIVSEQDVGVTWNSFGPNITNWRILECPIAQLHGPRRAVNFQRLAILKINRDRAVLQKDNTASTEIRETAAGTFEDAFWKSVHKLRVEKKVVIACDYCFILV